MKAFAYRHAIVAAIAVLALVIQAAAAPSTLARVKQNGYLRCGVSEGLIGFSAPDAKGNWTGIDIDFCKAVAVAIFDDPAKVRFRPTSAKVRLTALQVGDFDILARNTTWTMSRDVQSGVDFVGVIYYDGQGFMVPKKLGIASAKQLNGANICTGTGTTTELNLADYFRAAGMKYKVVAYERAPEVLSAYDNGRCDVYTTDVSGLYAQRLFLKAPNDHLILPEVISKEPLGPAVTQGDPQWTDLVRWTLFALVNAEELGVTSKNADQMLKSPSPEVRRLLGVEGAFGKSMGLSNDWIYRIVKRVGNYGEIFERNIGQGSRLKIRRGQNALWKNGGLMYAPPVR